MLILGAGHGIGFALAEEILNRNPSVNIYSTYRESEKAQQLLEFRQKFNNLYAYQCDVADEACLNILFDDLKTKTTHFDLVINSVGLLHNENISPEKSLKDIKAQDLMEYFRVNALVTPLVAKNLKAFMRKDQITCFASISAKVGSIADNKMGGWYGYRASKAALNMFIKNIAIEFGRSYKKSFVMAIHPGTTITELSQPFIKNTPYKLHTANETAKNILQVISNCNENSNGKFYSWDGEELPW